MNTNEKKSVEEHLLKASGYEPIKRGYKLIQRLFKYDELDFLTVNYDDAVQLRKELWFFGFECSIRWNKIIITDDTIVKYYENVMGLTAEPRVPEKSFYDKKHGL